MAAARCPYCGRWFKPWPGKGERQKTCGRQDCRVLQKQALDRQWWMKNPESRRLRDEKVRDRRREEGYWDKRRERDPDYVERNRAQTRERMRALRARRREAAEVLADPAGYLDRLRGPAEEMFATQELVAAISRRGEGRRSTMFATQELAKGLSVGMWRYLRAEARFATQEGADRQAGGTI